jgi:hypothetical protein
MMFGNHAQVLLHDRPLSGLALTGALRLIGPWA